MNLPNKLTISRIVMSLMIIIILIFPYHSFGLEVKNILVGAVRLPYTYMLSGVLFIIASITDFLDGNIARKNALVTDFGKLMDPIADKMLVNSVLIILCYYGEIHVIVPVIIILRDIIIDAFRMEAIKRGKVLAAIKTGKIKTMCLMIGLILALFKNIPFSLKGYIVSDAFLYFATIMSLISLVQLIYINKDIFKNFTK